MTLERRNGHVYLYKSRRVGKRVRKEYVANGYVATLIVRYDAIRVEQRKLARWQLEDRLDRWRERTDRLRNLIDRANELVADALRAAGWHQHKREWRKRRGTVMTTEVVRANELPTWVPSELDRQAGTLDPDAAAKAGKGDRSALPAVRKYLDNPAAVALWGDAGRSVLVRWARMRARGEVVTEEATLRYASALRTGLAGPNPCALQWLLAERVVLAWVAVATLEEWQGRILENVLVECQTKQAAIMDVLPKHIDHAHRQLMVACRTLAKVRRAKLPDILAVVHAAPADEAEPVTRVVHPGGIAGPEPTEAVTIPG